MKNQNETQDWPFSIEVEKRTDCPICREMVHNHDDYTLVVRYSHGDAVNAVGTIYHSGCLVLRLESKEKN